MPPVSNDVDERMIISLLDDIRGKVLYNVVYKHEGGKMLWEKKKKVHAARLYGCGL